MRGVLLLLAMGLVVHATNCPGDCTCQVPTTPLHHHHHHSTVISLTCIGPIFQLPPNITSLTIRTGDDSDSNSDSPLDLETVLTTFQNVTFLQLKLAHCSIETLDNITFDAPVNLQLLDLSQNHIVQLPEDRSVFNLTELRALDLSHNFIRALRGSPFRTLNALRVLNLSANGVESASVDSFCGLDSLQSLDLSINNFTALPNRVFVSLVHLQHLNLSGNRLRTLADGCFDRLLRLQQLDVSWNRLTHVAPDTLQSLPSLSRLLLAGNPDLGGGGVKETAFLVGTGRRLQAVDASRTGLKHVPATLTHSVRTLRLAGNAIRLVQCGDLDSYPLLQLLDLSTNVLEEIEEDALGRLEMLAILYLTDNKLHAIPRSLPDGLEILYLEFNDIEQIVSGDLLDLPKLEVLLLNDNGIKVVQEGAFNQVTSLVTLDLSRNPISILPADTLAGPIRLQTLKLSGLSVDPPAEDMTFPVPSPEYLLELDLSASPGLTRQLLADTAAVVAFRELQELNLADSDVINLRSDLLHYLPQMHSFHLTGNKLNCTNLLWLALWMRRQDEPEYRQVYCTFPPGLYGTLVVDLQDTDVQKETTSTTTVTEPNKSNETTTLTLIEHVNQSTMLQNTRTQTKNEKVYETTPPISVSSGVFASGNSNRSDANVDRDKTTSASPAVTDGHIDAINPSDNRTATEPSNYKTNTSTAAEEQYTSIETTEPQRQYANASDSFNVDNVTASEIPTSQEFSTTQEIDGDVLAGTAGETSMYSSNRNEDTASTSRESLQMHPGMVLLFIALLGAGVALSTLMSHVRRRRRRRPQNNGSGTQCYDTHQDIEVNSLSSMQELW